MATLLYSLPLNVKVNSPELSFSRVAPIQAEVDIFFKSTGTIKGGIPFSAKPAISTTVINDAKIGEPYFQQIVGVAKAPFSWSARNLPSGLSIGNTGVISGTPSAAMGVGQAQYANGRFVLTSGSVSSGDCIFLQKGGFNYYVGNILTVSGATPQVSFLLYQDRA